MTDEIPSIAFDRIGGSETCDYSSTAIGRANPGFHCVEGTVQLRETHMGIMAPAPSRACPVCDPAGYLEARRAELHRARRQDADQIGLWEENVRQLVATSRGAALDALAALPRHVFHVYEVQIVAPPSDLDHHRSARFRMASREARTWPWPVPGLSHHANAALMAAAGNQAGQDSGPSRSA